MKSVIFNADDFGSTSRANAAILLAHKEGVLSSASLMVNEPEALEAVALARENSTLAVGLHLALSNGFASQSHSGAPNIVLPSGRFQEGPAAAGMKYFFSPAARQQVRREVQAQFGKFAATGLPFSHVDGHQHLHLHPVIWDAMIACCEQFGVRHVRIPYEPWQPATTNNLIGRRVEWLFFRVLRRRCLNSIKGKGFTFADRVYGHLETGRMNAKYLIELLNRLEGQNIEIYFHPGTPHAQLMPNNPNVDVELEALINPEVRETIDRSGIRMSTYSDFAQFQTR